MGKLFKALVAVFAVVGVITSAGVGYVYATNSELMDQFWAVKDDFKAVAPERRKEVVAELPARITFEKQVGSDMQALPEERQKELYEQLTKSRDTVFEQFKQRIAAEAEIARKAEAAKTAKEDVAKEIEKQLGKVDVGVDLGGKNKTPKEDPLKAVNAAESDVSKATMAYGRAMGSSDGKARVDAAVGVLRALDKLGTEVQIARKKNLAAEDKSRLEKTVAEARTTLQDVKKTPGLDSNAEAMKLMPSVSSKLTLN
ncbi:MAG: hypothetical protein KF696_02770 [Planctomycetes bacterium]|nr:hypothetical protein [Planctomycetota bacterium]MCW8134927.1 hypothetical protein [Planctomycetota bacterium]